MINYDDVTNPESLEKKFKSSVKKHCVAKVLLAI